MNSPTTLGPLGVAHLQDRLGDVTVTYPDHPLPAGCEPSIGRIGLGQRDTDVVLFIDRGIGYTGADTEIREWCSRGEATFPSLTCAITWLRERIRPTDPPGSAGVGGGPGRPLTELLDVSGVRAPSDYPLLDATDLSAAIRAEVFGQDTSLNALAQLVTRHVNKRSPRRPASAVLLGPTGVGKTQTALDLVRALTELTGQQWGQLRYDMAEFTDRFSTTRLVGAPPGYVGYRDDTLATRLADNPRQVVLLDEIEKAHPDVLTSIMNLLDAGRLSTEPGGRAAREAIILMTSNLGSDELQNVSGPSEVDTDRAGRAHLRRHGLRPELVARIGQVFAFGPLTTQALVLVVAQSVTRLAHDHDVAVWSIDPAFASSVLEESQGGHSGARLIEYLVERRLGSGFARQRAGSMVTISADGSIQDAADAPQDT